MGWFRSEEMEYVSLMLQEDTAHDCISRIGKLGVFQFTDLNPTLTAFQRRFVSEIKRCDEMERKIRVLNDALEKSGVATRDDPELDRFLDHLEIQAMERPAALLLRELDEVLTEKERELSDLNAYHANLTRDYNEKVELLHVLQKASQIFSPDANAETKAAMDEEVAWSGRSIKFRFVTGVVAASDRAAFERMTFRTTRGNCFVRFADIEEPIHDPDTGLPVAKMVFIVFFQAPYIEGKLRKICDAFNATRYAVPDLENEEEVQALMRDTTTDLEDRKRVLSSNRMNLDRLVREELAVNVTAWAWTVRREKAIYHTLNMFNTDVPGFLRAEAWVVSSSATDAARMLREAGAGDGDSPNYMNRLQREQWPTPPTHFEVNKITGIFQSFVDTYGVPRYREANPAPFTLVTFPFLFGVMYGDVGHGTVLFTVACLLIWQEKRLQKMDLGEIFGMAFAGRYMLWGMSLCAIYMGFVYNDCFSLGLGLFPSTWKFVKGSIYAEQTSVGAVYPFGLDPMWHVASNELLFVNSMKMKLSVILGVSQMTFGLFLRLLNSIHFRSAVDTIFESIPQLIFMISFFGYMLFLIFYKWCTDWTKQALVGKLPPSLINVLINIVLKPGTIQNAAKYEMFPGQGPLQGFLLALAFLMVPTMLIPKPIILFNRYKNAKGANSHDALAGSEDETKGESALAPAAHHDEEEHGFGDLFIHQAIETIEFVLGSVSNTASYLRLWALSLAHSELATVFWDKAMVATIDMDNAFMVFIGYSAFASITVAVLLLMDVLECFLHALRLHWVEFQNKFFKADGYKFDPLHFSAILSETSS